MKPKFTRTTLSAFAASTIAVFGPSAHIASAIAGCSGYAYWTNSNAQTVEVVNLATSTSIATITGTGASQRAAVSPDGSKVIVAGSSKATIIDTATNTVANQITVGSTPLGVVFHPTRKVAYVANYGANSVSVINLATNTVSTTITGVTGAYGLTINADGSKLYATAAGDFVSAGTVKVINTVTNTISNSITVGVAPTDIRLSTDGTKAYTVNRLSGTGTSVSVINTSTNTVASTWSLTGTGSASSPAGMAISSTYLYVGMPVTGKYAKIDLSNGSSTFTSAGSTVAGLALSLDGAKLYVSQNGVNARSGQVELEMFDTSTDTSLGYISALAGTPNPTQMAVCPSSAPTGTPDFQLSASTGSVVAGSAASSLYTVSPTGWVIPTSFAISPTAPAGMTFNTSTGLLTGTPTTPQNATTYTITATSGGQTATATFALTVTLAAPNIQLSTSFGNASVGAPVGSLYSISQLGGAVASYSISPAAPAGMTFDATTGLLSGTPTTALATTMFSITATNATGTDLEAFTLTIAAATTTTTAGSTSSVSQIAPSIVAPTLVTESNKAQLEASPGEAAAIINGKEVAVEIVKVPVEATSAQQLKVAESIVADIAALLPKGATNPVSVMSTSTGPEINGIMVNPDNPKEKLGVPVESVQLVKAGDTAVLLAALNQTNLPAEKNAGGALEVTRGGVVSATAYGLAAAETGEIVLMSTPRLLQTFTVGATGGFKGQVALPKDISFGSHTVVMATKTTKVSLGIKLVRTRMQFRIKRVIGTALFKNRAGVNKAGGKVIVRGAGRCRATNKKVTMARKPGACYITVRQAAKGSYKAVYYRFTVSVVKKLIKAKVKVKK